MNDHITTSIVVAAAQNRTIGKNNDMPWHLPEDLKRFKRLTSGHPVIMGRKTYQSIFDRLGKALPGRDNIVITRQANFDADGYVVSSVKDAIEKAKNLAKEKQLDEIFVIGGAQIYSETLPLTDRIHLTEVLETIDGDAFFPELDDGDWKREVAEDDCNADGYRFITLNRIQP